MLVKNRPDGSYIINNEHIAKCTSAKDELLLLREINIYIINFYK